MEAEPPAARDGRPVRLRQVTMADADTMLQWQRHDETRRYFRNPAVPARDEHLQWLAAKLGDPLCSLMLIEHRDRPAGTLRLDGEPGRNCHEVSILVAPDSHRLGIGSAALELARQTWHDAELTAEVQPGNAPSRSLFERAGYRFDGRIYRSLPGSTPQSTDREKAACPM